MTRAVPAPHRSSDAKLPSIARIQPSPTGRRSTGDSAHDVTRPTTRSSTDNGAPRCGRPPKDQSRKFAIVAISLTVGAWVVLPAAVAIAFTN